MSPRKLILAALLATPLASLAEVTITTQILQQGIFQDNESPECKKLDPRKKFKNPDQAFCFTEVKIIYPQIENIDNTACHNQINTILKAKAEKSAQKGKPVELAKQDYGHNEVRQSFTIDLNKNNLLALTVESFEYWSGAAHGNIEIESFAFDLQSCRQLSVKDIIGNNESRVNDYIRKELKKIDMADPHAMQGKFIKKGMCDSCTISLVPQGIKITFQNYAVGPGALGPVTVILPKEYIASPDIKQALE